MSQSTINVLLWVGAALLLVLYMARRRKRKLFK